MAHRRHVYELVDEGSRYRLIARPTGSDSRGGTRVSRDRARKLAREPVINVVVEVCGCGRDALARYIEEHPRSNAAVRADRAASSVIGVVILVGIVGVAWSGWIATADQDSLPVDARVQAIPVGDVSSPPVRGYELRVEAVEGADRADGRIVVANESVPWVLEKGARARVSCQPGHQVINVVVGDRVVAWSDAPACDPVGASGSSSSSESTDRDVGEPSGCDRPVKAWAIASEEGVRAEIVVCVGGVT